tara:strand:+ start:368 stop:877 length:510 start_codon:yes stop_codon:yes gene_type:complete
MNQIIESRESRQSALSLDRDAVTSLERHSGFKIEEKLSNEFDLVGIELPADMTVADLQRARDYVLQTTKPADEGRLVQLLAQMQMMMKHRNLDAAHMDLMLAGYVDKLRQYPADAVEEGLNSLLDSCEWFPAWAEMRDAIAWRCQRRTLMLVAIDRAITQRQMQSIRSA